MERFKDKERGGIASWVRWAIREKSIVYALILALIAFGIVGLVKMNKDEFPEFQINQGLVVGVYPGATAQEVEEQLTRPLEESLFSFREIDRPSLKSVSKDGICYIYVTIECKESMKDQIWSKVKLGLQSKKLTLPAGVLAVAVMDDFDSVSSLLVALESSDKGYCELQEYAEDLSVKLRNIPEMSKVSIIGSQDEEIAVTLDRERLSCYGIDPATILLGYQTATLSIPSGTFKTDYTSSPIHIVSGVESEKEVAEKIVYSDPEGNIVRLNDIAKIERRYKDPSSFVSYNGHSCLILSIEMRPDNNIVQFGRDVDKVLKDFELEMPQSVTLSRITDQPKVVERSVFSFLRDLLISMLIVVMVMLLLFPIRSAMIASVGVPVCTTITLAIMYFLHIDINTVSLAALIMVLGMIVDDSIITIDGYMDKLGKGYSPVDAACVSAKELFLPTFIATTAICAMFYPMMGIVEGFIGDFIKDFPIIFTMALMTSLFFAVSVVPSLEIKHIKPAVPNARKNLVARMQDRFLGSVQKFYERAQRKCFKHPITTLVCGILLIGCGLFMFSRINVQMMPNAARKFFVVEMDVESGKSISKTKEYVDSLQEIMLKDDRIESVTAFMGTSAPRFNAAYAPKVPAPSMAQLIVNTKSTKATKEIIQEYEETYENIFPEVVLRFKQMDYNLEDAAIVINLTGDDRESLLDAAENIKRYMYSMNDELKWIHSNCDNYQSSVDIELDGDEAKRLGVNKTMLGVSLAGTFNGQTISNLWDGENQIPVNLYSEGIDYSMTYDTVENQMVPTTLAGVSVPLRQVASVTPDWSLSELNRIGGREAVSIYADMRIGRSQPQAMKKIEKFIDTEVRPGLDNDVEIKYGGLTLINKDLFPQVFWSFFAAVMVLFVFLLFHFKKTSLSILTLSMSMLCLFGAFFGLWVFGMDFTITAVLGLVSLIGIIVRNGILMYEYAEDQRFNHGADVKTAAMEAGKRRMRPIFLTSCTTALGVMPMIISGDLLWMPMGIVICFGTMLSIFLIVLIMPIAYWLLYRHSDNNIQTNEK